MKSKKIKRKDHKINWHTVKFTLKGKDYIFEVVHNLEYFGLDIESALHNWLARTKDFTQKSFMDYVKSKDDLIMCVSKEQFDNTPS